MKSLRRLLGLAEALLLSTVGAGALGAQELKFDGYFNSGLGVISSDIEDSDAILKAFGADAESNGYRFRLHGNYQNEAGKAGARFRLQSQSTLASGYFSLPYAYGWVKFLNDIFYAAGGIVDDGTWVSADWWLFSERLNTGLGTLLKATPVKGLDLGAGAYVINQQGGGVNNILGTGQIGFGTVTPKIGDVKYTFGGSYALPDVFRLSALFRLKNKAGYDKASTDDLDKYNGWHESSRLIGELRFLGVKDLTAIAAASFDKLEDFNDSGNIILAETFAYKFDGLSVGLNATQFLYKRGDSDADPGLLFNLWASYAFGAAAPRLDLAYFLGGQSTLAGGANTWHRRGFANKTGAKGADDDYSVFSARPSVKFSLDNRTSIEIGDKVDYDFANFDGYRKDGKAVSGANPGDTKSRLNNTFYVDFRWVF